MGVATDGVAQVVLRIPASTVGQTFSLTVDQDQCVTLSAADCGVLFDPQSPPGNLFTDPPLQSILVTAVPTTTGPMAIAAYRAPLDFVRSDPAGNMSDQTAAQRSLYIDITPQGGMLEQQEIELVRPPVVLIHGTFSGPDVFDDFVPLQPWYISTSPTFVVHTLSYDQNIDSLVISTFPSYPNDRRISPVLRNVVGVAYNAPLLLDELSDIVGYFETVPVAPVTFPIAAIQVDVVAHSLGGLMAQGMSHVGSDYTSQQQELFYGKQTYGRGYIHKLITIGVPHLGTNLALLTVNGDKVAGVPTVGVLFPNIGGNDCTRDHSATFGTYSLNSVTIGNTTFSGAVFDEYGDPTQGILSPTLVLLNQARNQAIPTALIAGTFSMANDSSDITFEGVVVQMVCGSRTIISPGTGNEVILPGIVSLVGTCHVKSCPVISWPTIIALPNGPRFSMAHRAT